MSILEAIAADHAEASALFDELAPLVRDDRRSSDVMRVAARLAVTVKTAAIAEHHVLHEALRTAGDRLSAFALESQHEFHALDVMLDKLLALRPGPDLAAVVAVAQRLFRAMIDRERHELLPAMGSELSETEVAQLGREHTAEKRRLRPRIERQVAAF
ncbi:MAG: hypothetical protein ABI867_21435 [Kofleriaceae bacterium]